MDSVLSPDDGPQPRPLRFQIADSSADPDAAPAEFAAWAVGALDSLPTPSTEAGGELLATHVTQEPPDRGNVRVTLSVREYVPVCAIELSADGTHMVERDEWRGTAYEGEPSTSWDYYDHAIPFVVASPLGGRRDVTVAYDARLAPFVEALRDIAGARWIGAAPAGDPRPAPGGTKAERNALIVRLVREEHKTIKQTRLALQKAYPGEKPPGDSRIYQILREQGRGRPKV